MVIVQRSLAFAALVIAALIIASCTGPANTSGAQPMKPEPYAVPVATGCIASTGRPTKPPPLNQRYTPEQWAAMPPGAKAEAATAQAGARMNYEDDDAAATKGCK